MEAMKMKTVFLAVALMMLMALSAVQNAGAFESPAEAPAPAADASAFVPAVFASVAALVVGMGMLF